MKQKDNEEYGENIYHFKNQIEKEKQAILNSKDITEYNKKLILDYCKSMKLKRGFSDSRINKLLNKLKLIARLIKKDFNKVDEKDNFSFNRII